MSSLGLVIFISEEDISYKKQPDIWATKELINPCILCNIEFFTPRRTKSIQYIGLRFHCTVNRAVDFQYSGLIFLELDQKRNCLC